MQTQTLCIATKQRWKASWHVWDGGGGGGGEKAHFPRRPFFGGPNSKEDVGSCTEWALPGGLLSGRVGSGFWLPDKLWLSSTVGSEKIRFDRCGEDGCDWAVAPRGTFFGINRPLGCPGKSSCGIKFVVELGSTVIFIESVDVASCRISGLTRPGGSSPSCAPDCGKSKENELAPPDGLLALPGNGGEVSIAGSVEVDDLCTSSKVFPPSGSTALLLLFCGEKKKSSSNKTTETFSQHQNSSYLFFPNSFADFWARHCWNCPGVLRQVI